MAFLSESSIVTPACYIALPVAHIAPFATIVWSDLITIVPGWANVSELYVDIKINFCFLSFFNLFFYSFIYFHYWSSGLIFCFSVLYILNLTNVTLCSATTVSSFVSCRLQRFFASMCFPCQLSTSRFWWMIIKALCGWQWRSLLHRWY